MSIGVYCIRNVANDKRYVGSTYYAFKDRERIHFPELEAGTHMNPNLQQEYNIYGKDNFVFEILEKVPKDQCREREQYWIDYYKPNIYNCKNVNGVVIDERTKQRISKALKGKKRTAEQNKANSERRKGCIPWNKGIKMNPEQCRKDYTMTDEQKEKLRQTANRPDVKKKKSEAMKKIWKNKATVKFINVLNNIIIKGEI